MGIQILGKGCKREYDKSRRTSDEGRAYVNKLSKAYYENHKNEVTKRHAAWRSKNREYIKAYLAEYNKNNIHKRRAKCRKYQVAKLFAVPKWVTKEEIKQIEMFYKACPIGYEVDHIIPIQGKNVCGLHTMSNLQYLPIAVNRSKGNKY